MEFRLIFPLVQLDPGLVCESLYNQMKKLIFGPLKESTISTVIVIDALDECEDEEPASAILSVLGQFVSKIPKVRFFLTGRPEPQIREGFRLPLLAEAMNTFILHEIESSLVNNDIQVFLEWSFLELTHRRHGLDGWPTKEQMDLLCKRAAGLFIYAVATAKFIDSRNSNPKTQLDRLLQSPESSAREGKTRVRANITLDSLYTSILQEAFGHDDPEDDPKIHSVLITVILATNPFSPSTISTLLRYNVDDVFLLLSSVHSLLILQEDFGHPVQPFHKSFPDFIIDPAHCTNQRFHVSPPDHHSQLLVSCLDLMNRRLEKNICKFPDAVANSDVSNLEERIRQYIDPALQYACRSWHTHLINAHKTPAHTVTITSSLHQFLKKKFLFWLEVLSVLGAVSNAVDALQVVTDWLEVCLVFRASGSWDLQTAAVVFFSKIKQAVWSPCSRFIAVTWGDSLVVDILDSVTLQRLQTLETPQGTPIGHRALGFSPDSHMLTCSSIVDRPSGLEFCVVVWDLQLGGIVSIIRGQGPRNGFSEVNSTSIMYSMDGKMVAVFYPCDSSIMIFICNLTSGVHIHTHSFNLQQFLRGPDSNNIWTHGGSLRFVTAAETTITIWEVGFTSGTPKEVKTISLKSDVENQPLELDIQLAEWILFLPTLSRLVITNYYGTLLVWDTQNSKSLLHCEGIKCHPRISSSSDGHFLPARPLDQKFTSGRNLPLGTHSREYSHPVYILIHFSPQMENQLFYLVIIRPSCGK